MKAMNKGEILNFLDLTKDDEDPEFPYIKEYRRFLQKCYEDIEGKYASGNEPIQEKKDVYDLTSDLAKQKESEWWFRQKYKLMKAMKKKFAPDGTPTNHYPQNDTNMTVAGDNKSPTRKQIKQSIDAGLEAIEEDRETREADSVNFDMQTDSPVKVNVETSTGPDIVHMLSLMKDHRNSEKKSKQKKVSSSTDLGTIPESPDPNLHEEPPKARHNMPPKKIKVEPHLPPRYANSRNAESPDRSPMRKQLTEFDKQRRIQ